MMRLYTTLLRALRPVASFRAACARPGTTSRIEWDERLGRRFPSLADGVLWIHGASLGEARIVEALARALRVAEPNRQLAVSAFTPSGRAALPAPPQVDAAFFLPLDFPSACEPLVDALRPAALGLVETELWPVLLRTLHERRVPIVVLNARLSSRRMARYRRLRSLYAPLLGGLRRVAAQSPTDADRFAALGVPRERITVAGNIKYDLLDGSDRSAPIAPAELFADPSRRLLVAGSTADGEDAIVLDAFRKLRDRHPGLALVLAPRHLERADRVERTIREQGLRVARRSSGRIADDVLLLDTHGELGAIYALAAVAFVGGSLVPIGGHNVLEPAALGVPVLFGPHTEHVEQPAAALLDAGAARRVTDAAELADAADRWLSDTAAWREAGRSAASVVERHRGALARNVEVLLEAAGPTVPGPA